MENKSMQLRVLLVSGIYYPDIGGPATFIPKLAQALKQRKFAVRTLSLTDNWNQVRPKEEWKRIFISRKLKMPLRFIVTIASIRFHAGSKSKIFSNGLYEETAIASLFGCHPTVAKIVGDPIWERYRNKVNPDVTLEAFNENRILPVGYRFQRTLLVWSLNRFQTITVPSQQLAELVTKWGVRTRVAVIANGIQITNTSHDQKEFDVITVSRLVSWKNIDIVINICKELKLKLAVVGSGPEELKLKEMAKDGHVFFLGDLTHEETMKTLSKSRVFAMLSSYEGLSHSLLEAMNIGIPVIVSDAPGNTSVIHNGENGLVVSLQNEPRTASSFLKLLGDSSYAEKLATKAKQDVMSLYNQDVQLEHFVGLLGP